MAVTDEKLIPVRNLVDHTVVFRDDETHQRIAFNPFEVKKLKAGLLRRLNYSYGGNVLLQDYLSVRNKELAKEFGVSEDTVEYDWTEKDVEELLLNGEEDALLDALDFGPQGIVDLIVDKATELKINDVLKRRIISDKTGIDVNARIQNQEKLDKATGKQDEAPKKATRRVNKQQTAPTGRRVETTAE